MSSTGGGHPQDVGRAITQEGGLLRIGRVAAYTRHRLAGEHAEAQSVLLDELRVAEHQLDPFLQALVWLVATVADRRPGDLDAFLSGMVGLDMTALALHLAADDPR